MWMILVCSISITIILLSLTIIIIIINVMIVEARHGNPNNSPIRIRTLQTINNVVYIRCLVIGGPFDIYYMVRPESSERGDPDDRTIMRYGEKVRNDYDSQ